MGTVAALVNEALTVRATMQMLPDSREADVIYGAGTLVFGAIVDVVQRRPAVTLDELSAKAALFDADQEETELALSIARDVRTLLPAA